MKKDYKAKAKVKCRSEREKSILNFEKLNVFSKKLHRRFILFSQFMRYFKKFLLNLVSSVISPTHEPVILLRVVLSANQLLAEIQNLIYFLF